MSSISNSNALTMAILSLDSYNRDYGQGVNVPGDQLGAWTVKTSLNAFGPDFQKEATADGFDAVAYTHGNTTVISYRGTDNSTFSSNGQSGGSDILNGWTLGAGFSNASQAVLAEQFYTDVATGQTSGAGVSASAALQYVMTAPSKSNIVLTGHSLGGWLAGSIADLTGDHATIFDNMPFGAAVGAPIEFLQQRHPC